MTFAGKTALVIHINKHHYAVINHSYWLNHHIKNPAGDLSSTRGFFITMDLTSASYQQRLGRWLMERYEQPRLHPRLYPTVDSFTGDIRDTFRDGQSMSSHSRAVNSALQRAFPRNDSGYTIEFEIIRFPEQKIGIFTT